ncbi:MAG: hypothetical protein V1739_02940 [Candidatus Omnitrophota bacterium]
MHSQRKQKGFALMLCLIVIILLAVLSTVLINRYIVDTRNTEIFTQGVRAFWLAESGMGRAIWEYNYGVDTWVGWTTSTTDKLFSVTGGLSGDYDIVVQNYLSTTPTVISTGYFPNKMASDRIVRTVRAVIGRGESLFQYAAFGDKSLKLGGTMYSDSYDSDAGMYGEVLADGSTNIAQNGDVGTNGDITTGGGSYINGDASTGLSGTFNDQSAVSGTIEHNNNLEFPLILPPAYLQSLPSGGSILSGTTLGPGNYQFSRIQLSSSDTLTITGPAEIYLTAKTAIKMSASSAIVIDPATTGTVKIYFDGNIDIESQGIINTTYDCSNVLLVGTNPVSQTVKISGQQDMYAAVYAPKSDVTLSGGVGYFGSYIGSTVTSLGTSALHYDEELADNNMGISFYTHYYWIDSQRSYAVYP